MRKLAVTAFILAALAAGTAQAQERAAAGELTDLKPVGADTLGKANGKEGLSLNVSDLESTHSFNQANGAATGNATIGAGALSNVSGVAAVVVNTGNNAVVQISQQVVLNLH